MIALLTGASRGIGRAIALELADLGFDLALVGRDQTSLEETASMIHGVKISLIIADLSDPASAKYIVEETVSAFGGLDLLVNCAGVPQKGPFTDVTPQEWDKVFAVNARAPFFICQAEKKK